jgi:hypothetical protein
LIICVILCANAGPKLATNQEPRPEALGVAWLRKWRNSGSPLQIFHAAMSSEVV